MIRVLPLLPVLTALLLAQVPSASPELKQAAAETRIKAIAALYEEFAVPHDRVRLRDRTQDLRVAPLAEARSGDLRGTIKLVPIDASTTEKPEVLAKFPAADILTLH